MKVYIINLPASNERRTHAELQMQTAGITEYEFIEAITDEIPAIGCMKSHRAIWQKIIDQNAPALILEDDAVLNSSFYSHFYSRLPNLLEHGEVGLIGYQLREAVPMHTYVQHWRFLQEKSKVEFNGAYAYVVNGKSAAEKLIHLTENTPAHPDLAMMDGANGGQLKLMFMCFPLVHHGSFGSTLSHNTKPAPNKKP